MKRFSFFFIALFALFSLSLALKAQTPIWSAKPGGNLALSSNGAYVAIIGEGLDDSLAVLLYNARNGELIHKRSYYSQFFNANFSMAWLGFTKSNLLIVGSTGTVSVLDCNDFNELRKIEWEAYGSFKPMTISPNDSVLAISDNSNISFWNINTGTLINTISLSQGKPNFELGAIKFTTDGNEICYYSYYYFHSSNKIRSLNCYNLQTDSISWNTSINFSSLWEISPNGSLLAFFPYDEQQRLQIMDLNTKTIINSIQTHNNNFSGLSNVCFSKDNKYLVYSDLNTFYFYDLQRHKELNKWDPFYLLEVALSPNSDTLFTTTPTLHAYSVSDILSVENTPKLRSLSISPNPSYNSMNVSFNLLSSLNLNIAIYNTMGERVKELYNNYYSSETFNESYDISDLPSGAYILSVQGADLKSSAKFFIVR